MKNLGSSLGLHDEWYFQTVGDSTLILSRVKQRIKDQFLQNWNSRFICQRQVQLYFIETLQTLLFNHNEHFKHWISQKKYVTITFIVTPRRLCIATGRWNQPTSTPINNRIYIFCQSLEDEYHFIIECNSYLELRKQLIPIYHWKHPNMLKFTELINCTNARILRKLDIMLTKRLK